MAGIGYHGVPSFGEAKKGQPTVRKSGWFGQLARRLRVRGARAEALPTHAYPVARTEPIASTSLAGQGPSDLGRVLR